MWMPYTASQQDAMDAFMAAQTSLGAVLTAIVWRKPLRPRSASVTILAAAWLAILTPIMGQVLSVTCDVPMAYMPTLALLNASAALATVAMVLNQPRWLALVALAGQLCLMWIGQKVTNSDNELVSLHV